MKPPVRQDYSRSEPTDPSGSPIKPAGNVPAAPISAPPAYDEDEFPSEATRIDASYTGGASTPAPKPAPASTSKPIRVAASTSKPIRVESPPPESSPAQNKLAALQSLSLGARDSTGSTRLPPTPKATGGNSRLPWVLLMLVLAGLGGNWAWSKYHASSTDHPLSTIRTEIITPTGGSGPALRAAGYAAARTPSTVGMPTSGRIQEIKVENNTKVKRGQIVAKLDASQALADRGQASAEIRVAEETLKQKKMLFKAQVISAVELHQAEAQVSLARAKLFPINQRVEQANVRSPIDGTVLELVGHAGDTLTGAAPIMKIADLSHMTAEFEIVENEIVKLFVDQEVEAIADSFPGRPYKGRVREIANQADKAKGTVLVKVDLEVPDQSLRPGMSIKGSFLPNKNDKPHLYIPKSALTPQGTVWLVGSDHRVTRRAVKTGPAVGASIEVLEGLIGGERVVDDASSVHEGQTIVDPPPAQ